MTNTSKKKPNIIAIEGLYDFQRDVIKGVKDIKKDEKKLVKIARKVPFVSYSKKKSGFNMKLMNIVDDNNNVISRIKVSNGENIAPEVKNPVVENMVVVSVGMKGDNLESLLRAISTK